MSGLMVVGIIFAAVLVFDMLVAAFGVDSRPNIDDERFGTLST